tara:strand:+ start:15942 stop:16109 length:168 start_codon:yes stop_codon:yes gene_type:complete
MRDAARLDAVRVVKVVPAGAQDRFASLCQANASKSSSDPSRGAAALFPPSLVSRG